MRGATQRQLSFLFESRAIFDLGSTCNLA